MSTSQAVTVYRNDGENRYELRAGDELAGVALYRDSEDQRVFYHTEVEKAFGGRGLSNVLITRALTDTREAGKRVVAVCPFVAAYLRKHPEFSDITQPATAETLRWLESTVD